MRKLISIFTVLFLLSCKQKSYRYEIRCNIMTKNGQSPAIIYADSLSFDGGYIILL